MRRDNRSHPAPDTQSEAGTATATLALSVLAGVLAVVFLVICGFRVLDRGSLPPSRDAAEQIQQRQDAVTTAARKATVAFLNVDYRDMAPRVKKVLALATGTFHKQYATAQVNLTAAAQQGQAISTGVVRSVGLTDVGAATARAFVAADSTVSNTLIAQAKAKGQAVDDKRYYRFQLDLTLVHGQWLVNDLQFVG